MMCSTNLLTYLLIITEQLFNIILYKDTQLSQLATWSRPDL